MFVLIWLVFLLHCSYVKSLSILVPLYSWPTDWGSVYSAIEASNITWQIVINPDNGPDTTENHPAKADYTTGLAKLSSYKNVIIIGYVRTNYMQFTLDTVKAQVDTYASWNSYPSAKLSVDGIFFDEVSGKDAGSTEVTNYYTELSGHVKSQFQSATKPVIFNPGALGPENLFDVCDIMIEFEGWAKDYQGTTTISTFPQAHLGKCGIMIYDADALDTSVASSVQAMAGAGIGSVFLDYGYVDGGNGKPTGNYKIFTQEHLTQLAGAVAAGGKSPTRR